MTTAVAKPGSVRIGMEARKARHRLYPVSIVYSLSSLAVIGLALDRRPGLAIAFYALGVGFWTAIFAIITYIA